MPRVNLEMSILTKLVSALALIYSSITLSCTHQISSAYPALKTDDGYIVFNETPLTADDDAENVELGIDVRLYKCTDNSKHLIGELPFLAATGKIIAAFFADANHDWSDELFVIHAVPISSDTGVRYSSDYYSVHVYEKSINTYSRNERLSNYFGAGGDILDEEKEDLLAYKFPYKNEVPIREKLSSENYSKWVSGEEVAYTVNKKTYIHSFPVLAESTRMYLVSGDTVTQDTAEGGWISIIFNSPSKKEVRGWIKCEDIDGC